MNMRMAWSWVVLGVVSAALLACGGDDDGGQPVAGTGGVGGGLPTSGTGASGVGGGSGMGGAGGTMAAMPVPCGTNTCQPLGGGIAAMIPGLGAALPMPCCLDAAMGTCGTMMAGGACMPPPVSDPRCPPLNFAGMQVASCCTPSGVCGANASQLGFGCVDPGMFTGMPGMACDGSDDAGVDDNDGGV